MAEKSINRIRIQLLAECFGISGVVVLVTVFLLKHAFTLEPRMVVPSVIWVLIILSTTGIAQIIGNEIWLLPIIAWHSPNLPSKEEEKKVIPAIKLLFLLSLLLVFLLIIGIFLIRRITTIAPKQILSIGAVGLVMGMAFLLSWFLIRTRLNSKLKSYRLKALPALEIANAFLKFPLKSAGLSLLLWLYAGIALALIFYYRVGFSTSESFFILIVAFACGLLAFPLQYLLFKQTFKDNWELFLNQQPEIIEEKNLFQFSLRIKLLIYFSSLTIFAISISFLLIYSKSLEIIKNKSAELYQSQLKAEIATLPILPEPQALKKFFQQNSGSAETYFLISKDGQILFGDPESSLTKEQIKEMLGKNQGVFSKVQTANIVAFQLLPQTNFILGKIHSGQKIKEEIRKLQLLALGFIPIILVVCILFALLASLEIFSPIQAMVREANLVAQRNFEDRAFLISDDETNQLAGSFYQMRTAIKGYVLHLEEVMTKTKATTALIDSTTQLLSNIAKEQIEGSMLQSASMEEAQSSLEEMVVIIKQLETKSENIKSSAQKTFEAFRQGKEVLFDAINAEESAQNQVKKIQQSMELLERHSQKIKEIVAIIEEISVQSNLLALNALVESAATPETGKRFAVVANEMKKLADMTKQFNASIGSIIKDVINAIAQAIKATREGAQLMDKSAELANRAGDAFERFSELIELSVSTSEEISSSMNLQAKFSEEFTQSLSNIRVVAEQVASRAREIENSIEKLLSLEQEMKTLVGF